VEYEFWNGEKHHTSRKLHFGVQLSQKEYARRIVEKYPPGKPVLVYYNPASGTAVLEPRVTKGTWFLLCMGGFFFAMGISILLKEI